MRVTIAATNRMAISGLTNWRSSTRHQGVAGVLANAFGPYFARRRVTSPLLSPRGEDDRDANAASAVRLCHGGGVAGVPSGVLEESTVAVWRLSRHSWRSFPVRTRSGMTEGRSTQLCPCLLYTSDAADDLLCVDLGGR